MRQVITVYVLRGHGALCTKTKLHLGYAAFAETTAIAKCGIIFSTRATNCLIKMKFVIVVVKGKRCRTKRTDTIAAATFAFHLFKLLATTVYVELLTPVLGLLSMSFKSKFLGAIRACVIQITRRARSGTETWFK